jgi:hypothetical protein
MSPPSKIAYFTRVRSGYSVFSGNFPVRSILFPAHPADLQDILFFEFGAMIVFPVCFVCPDDVIRMQTILTRGHRLQVGDVIVHPVTVDMIDMQTLRDIAVMVDIDKAVVHESPLFPLKSIYDPEIPLHIKKGHDPALEIPDRAPRLLDPHIPRIIDGIKALGNKLHENFFLRTHRGLRD